MINKTVLSILFNEKTKETDFCNNSNDLKIKFLNEIAILYYDRMNVSWPWFWKKLEYKLCRLISKMWNHRKSQFYQQILKL